jgi:succinate dehydrogenase / fumarate reductase cytochrome b subunit
MTTPTRPLSPHLSIYKFTLTMAMSIIHRITGVANTVGTLLLVLWLGAAAIGDGALGPVNALFGSWFGQIVLFGYTWSLIHHMLGGIKHFIWDRGVWMFHPEREWVVQANLAGSIVLTLMAWAIFVWF